MKSRQRVIAASSIAFPVSLSASVLGNVSWFPSRTSLFENERRDAARRLLGDLAPVFDKNYLFPFIGQFPGNSKRSCRRLINVRRE